MNEYRIWDRAQKKYFVEKIAAEEGLRWLYDDGLVSGALRFLAASSVPSKIFGLYQDSAESKKSIPEFIKKFSIDMDEFEDQEYKNFNEFFIRKFKKDRRNFHPNSESLTAFAEARYLFFQRKKDYETLFIKGKKTTLEGLVGESFPADFKIGAVIVARLCPVDYHRFHFIDEGNVLWQKRIAGRLDSVHRIALEKKPEIFLENERQVAYLETKNFGKVFSVEVGATFVGRIEQTYSKTSFQKGQEKGYFLFGGSTVVCVFEENKIQIDEDLLEKSMNSEEVLIRLGEKIGIKK